MKNLFKLASANENFAGFLFLEGGPHETGPVKENKESSKEGDEDKKKNKEKKEAAKNTPAGKVATEINNKEFDSLTSEEYTDEIIKIDTIPSNTPGNVVIKTTIERTFTNGFTDKEAKAGDISLGDDLTITDADTANRIFAKLKTIENSEEIKLINYEGSKFNMLENSGGDKWLIPIESKGNNINFKWNNHNHLSTNDIDKILNGAIVDKNAMKKAFPGQVTINIYDVNNQFVKSKKLTRGRDY